METVNELNKLLQEFRVNYMKLVKKSMTDAYKEFRYTAEKQLNADLQEQLFKSRTKELSEYELYQLISVVQDFDDKMMLNMVDIWLLARKEKGKKSIKFHTFVGTGLMAVEEAKKMLGGRTEVRTGRDEKKYVIDLDTQNKVYVHPYWSALLQ
jgi:hypothetical protein